MPSTTERQRSQMDIQPELQAKVNAIAGFQTAVIPRPSLPGSGGGLPLQFVIQSDADYDADRSTRRSAVNSAIVPADSFLFMMKEVEFTRPKATLVIDRNRAADLGISMENIGRQSGCVYWEDSYINRLICRDAATKLYPRWTICPASIPASSTIIICARLPAARCRLHRLCILRNRWNPASGPSSSS